MTTDATTNWPGVRRMEERAEAQDAAPLHALIDGFARRGLLRGYMVGVLCRTHGDTGQELGCWDALHETAGEGTP